MLGCCTSKIDIGNIFKLPFTTTYQVPTAGNYQLMWTANGRNQAVDIVIENDLDYLVIPDKFITDGSVIFRLVQNGELKECFVGCVSLSMQYVYDKDIVPEEQILECPNIPAKVQIEENCFCHPKPCNCYD
jgi:hypothetical protein